MIPLWITAFAFCSVAYFTGSRTYIVLALSSIVNIYIDHFTSDTDRFLMVTYSAIEFFTCLSILHFGNCHKIYQSTLLFLMLILHFVMEVALVNDYAWFIESEIYSYLMSGLIIAQLIGAGRGMDSIYWADSYRSKNSYLAYLDCQTSNFAKDGKK